METLKLDRRIKENLEEAGINTITAILAASERDLLSVANLSLSDIKYLRSLASSSVSLPQRVSTLLNQNPGNPRWWARRLSVGCPIIDLFLRGGFPQRGIVELSGASGSGKTQFCLQVALSAQIPSLQNNRPPLGTIYVCTENPFPSQRLCQLMQAFPQRYPESSGVAFGDKIFVEHIADVASLKECLQIRVPRLLGTSCTPFGLIVIDSIAGVFRGSTDYDDNETSVDEQVKGVHNGILSRAKDLKEIGGELHNIASLYGLSVICINQVSDAMDNIQGLGCEKKIPALGLSWANMVTTRLMISRTQICVNLEENCGNDGKSRSNERTLVRELEVIFSPELPPTTCRFVILQSGVEGIP